MVVRRVAVIARECGALLVVDNTFTPLVLRPAALGADIVVHHHPHTLQGVETFEGAMIAYSMGNFIFPGMYLTEYGEESMLLRVGYADERVRYVELVPVRIDHQTISVDTSDGALDRVLTATRRLNAE